MSRVMLVALVVVGCGPQVVEEPSRPTSSVEPVEAPVVAPVETPPHLLARKAKPAATEALAPVVSRFSPSQGLVGTRVRVVGSGFSPVPEENRVFFGSVRCGVPAVVLPSSSEAMLEFDVPEGAVTNQLFILVGARTVVTPEPFTVLTGPLVWDVEPRTVLINTRDHLIDITGDGFSGTPVVKLDGQALTVTQVSTGRLTAIVPFSLKTVAREAVLSVEGAASTLRLVIENPPPVITSVTPAALHSRVDRVTVSGAGFVPDSVVLVDEQPVPTTWDHGSLVAEVAALPAGPHLVRVSTPRPGGGVSAAVPVLVE